MTTFGRRRYTSCGASAGEFPRVHDWHQNYDFTYGSRLRFVAALIKEVEGSSRPPSTASYGILKICLITFPRYTQTFNQPAKTSFIKSLRKSSVAPIVPH